MSWYTNTRHLATLVRVFSLKVPIRRISSLSYFQSLKSCGFIHPSPAAAPFVPLGPESSHRTTKAPTSTSESPQDPYNAFLCSPKDTKQSAEMLEHVLLLTIWAISACGAPSPSGLGGRFHIDQVHNRNARRNGPVEYAFAHAKYHAPIPKGLSKTMAAIKKVNINAGNASKSTRCLPICYADVFLFHM